MSLAVLRQFMAEVFLQRDGRGKASDEKDFLYEKVQLATWLTEEFRHETAGVKLTNLDPSPLRPSRAYLVLHDTGDALEAGFEETRHFLPKKEGRKNQPSSQGVF